MSILVIDTIEPKNDAFTTLVHAEHVGLGTVDDTEFSYLNGASSNIQDQLNTKDALITVGTGLQRITNQLSLSHLGLESLTDPGADRIMFWDETDNALKWLQVSTGLSISGTILSCSITQYTDALARAALSSSATGLTYTEATGVFSLTADYSFLTAAQISTWDAKMTNPMTAAGDLIVGGVGGTPTRLPIGSNGKVLGMVSGTPTWSDTGPAATPVTPAGDPFLTTLMMLRFHTATGTYLLQAFCDGYCDEAWVDTATSSNEVYNSTNDCYDVTLAEATFFNATSNTTQSGIGDSGGNELRQGQQFIIAAATTISKVTAVLGATTGSPTGGITCRIETDSAGKPSGTLAHSWATKNITPTASATNTWTFPDLVALPAGTYWIVWDCSNQAANQYWALREGGAGVGTGPICQRTNGTWGAVENTRDFTYAIYKKTVSGNILLQSIALEPDGVYDDIRFMLCVQHLDYTPGVLGTDLIVSVSRDGGSTWTAATLTDRGYYNYSTRRKLLYGSADVAAQPSGSDIRYKIVSANNVAMRFWGMAVAWE